MAKNSSGVRGQIIRLIISLLVICAVILSVYLVLRHFGLTGVGEDKIRLWLDSTGAWAPAVFILISFLQVTFIPIPGAITIVAGYYFFGFWGSFIYSYIGMMLGAIVGYILGRVIGRPFVVWLAGSEDKLDGWLSKLRGRENLLLFFMFLLPLFPDDLLCSVAGVIPQKPTTFIIMQLITRTTSIGATLISTAVVLQGWPFAIIIAVALALVIPIFIWCYKNIERVSDFFAGIGKRKNKK